MTPATITGEPLPVVKAGGDEVFAGTSNGTGALQVRVTRDASESVIARIVSMVEEAAETKAPTQLFIEKVEQLYSIGMVAATRALFGLPLAFGAALDPTLLRAMTFMIVASSCAVVLATMPPLLSAMANAGRHGVLVKSAVVMERVGQVDAVALDKTGTLAEGSPVLTGVWPVAGTDLDDSALLTLAAAAERPSEHPLGRAVVDAAADRGLHAATPDDFASVPGPGVRATVHGARVQIGAPARLLDGLTGLYRTTKSWPYSGWKRPAGRCWWSVTASTTRPRWPPPTPASAHPPPEQRPRGIRAHSRPARR